MTDWSVIKDEYVNGKASYKELAKKHGVPLGELALRAREEKWLRARREKTGGGCPSDGTGTDKNHLTKLMAATNNTVDVVLMATQQGEKAEKLSTDTKALKELTTVLKDLSALLREFYDLPTQAQAEAQRIASERLELDRLKAAGDDADDEPDEPVTVRFVDLREAEM